MRFLAATLVAAIATTAAYAGLPVAYDAELKAFENRVRGGDPLGFSLIGSADCSGTPVYSQILRAGTPQVIVEQVAPVRTTKGDKTPEIARKLSSVEKRCQDLGATCLCSEPLEATTHSQTSGPYDDQPWNPAEGQTAWINFVDPDDSKGKKECYGNNSLFPHTPGNGGTWMYFNPAGGPPLFVSGASQLGYLPNNTLTSVMHYTAGDTAFAGEPTINATEPNHTYCMRGYKRWTGRGNWVPGVDPVNPAETQQTKVLTFIGNNQISAQWYGGGPNGPEIGYHRVDMRWGTDGSEFGSPTMLNFDECVGHYCRFEVCMDHFADGTSQGRAQAAVVGTTKVVTLTSPRTTGTTSTFYENAFQGGGLQLWTQGPSGPQDLQLDVYFTHAMVAVTPTVDTGFFIGAACEVEGGCTGQPHP